MSASSNSFRVAVPIVGRAQLIDELWQGLTAGHTILLHGPVGIGKTTVLDAIDARARRAHKPCARAPRTEQLADVTRALADAYPEVAAATQRQLRGRLRLAVERRPGLLLLDQLGAAGTATKGFLRSLRGLGLGVLLAGDVEHPRDRQRLRDFGLAYRELEVPPLSTRSLSRVLGALVPSLRPLHSDDEAALLVAARGRPGWLVAAAERLGDKRYWSDDGRIRSTLLAADLAVATARRLFRR